MTIGFDGSRAFVTGRTGTENYSYQLLRALAKIDCKNHYIVYIRPGVQIGGGWPNNFQFSILNFQFLWTQTGLAIQTFKDPLDVLFIPAHTLPLIRKSGLKTVVTVHDLGSEYLPSMHQFKQRLYLGLMQKVQLKTASKIISVSKSTKLDLINKIGIEEKKIKVVYEGYDREKFRIQNSEFRINQTINKYNLKYQNYFLFVGTVQPRKNLERLIKAFSKYLKAFDDGKWKIEDGTLKMEDGKIDNLSSTINPQNATFHFLPSTVKLVIAGSKGWLSEGIYQLPKKLGIEDKVKFLGYIPEEDLPALYSGALALTFPSLFEGFGLPILEAQACGCPVLTSNISSMPEVAGQRGAVYVNPYDVDDIVKGMERVQGTGYRLQLIKAGLENVKKFSWEKCAAQTLKVLEEAMRS